MHICGIVAEYNPFHNGHAYLINQARSEGATHIVSVMSGNFVQRGEPALFSKFARARTAVQNGVDLVLELPVAYSLSTAMYFAGGAIDILRGLGVVEKIVFGSECGNITSVKNICSLLQNELFKPLLKKELDKGITFATARTNAIKKLSLNAETSVLENPNDILAVEYILAAQRLNYSPAFSAVKRNGAAHDSNLVSDGICSASKLRNHFQNNVFCKKHMPDTAYQILSEEFSAGHYACYSLAERAVITHLRTQMPSQLRNVPDVSEGLENRILLAANRYSNLEEILEAVKTKRYTHARLRRIILASYLELTADLQRRPAPYIRVLAMSERGAEILAAAKKKSSLNVVASLKDAERIGNVAAEFVKTEIRAGDIYSMMLKNPIPGKQELTIPFYKTF